MKQSLLIALTGLAASTVMAETPAHIDITGFKDGHGATVIDAVVVPVPSEIFVVLDKQQGKPAWAEVLHPRKEVATAFGSPEQISLLLGAVIAEGFIAVEAENAAEVENIGRSVLKLSQAIHVEKAVQRHSQAIIDFARKRDWKEVRQELDKAQFEVKAGMIEIQSQDLAQLVSLGGWLRGTEALGAVVQKNFTQEGAELLHQPMLVKHFKTMLDKSVKKDPLVAKMKQGLITIEPLMAGSEGTAEISPKAVDEISKTATELLKAINQKPVK